MTEHNTPSTARTEAERQQECGLFYTDDAQSGFVKGAEWALAQVREGLKDSRTTPVPTRFGGYFTAVWLADALAVVDRLEGKQ